jgi:hypothetical protein
MNSNATAGISRARPRTCVCWVATAASCDPEKLDEDCRPATIGRTAVSFAAGREEIAADIGATYLM